MTDTDTINRDADQAETEGPAPDLLQAEADAVLDGITDAAPVEPVTGGAAILASFNADLMREMADAADAAAAGQHEEPAADPLPDPEDVDASATLADPMAVMEAVHAVLHGAARTMGLLSWLAWSPPVDSLADAEPADVEQVIDAVQRLRGGEHPADVHDAWCADSIQRRGLGLGDGFDSGTRPHLVAWSQLDGEVRGALIAVTAMLRAT
ncbi:MAG: hypothetical protein RIQ53_3298 [Pseudomonadota bacterium]|jgi:hypothetical protein